MATSKHYKEFSETTAEVLASVDNVKLVLSSYRKGEKGMDPQGRTMRVLKSMAVASLKLNLLALLHTLNEWEDAGCPVFPDDWEVMQDARNGGRK